MAEGLGGKTEEEAEGAKDMCVPDEIRATLGDHVLNHRLSVDGDYMIVCHIHR